MQKWFSQPKTEQLQSKTSDYKLTRKFHMSCLALPIIETNDDDDDVDDSIVCVCVRTPAYSAYSYMKIQSTEIINTPKHSKWTCTVIIVREVQNPNSPQFLRRFFWRKIIFQLLYLYGEIFRLNIYCIESSLFVCFIGGEIWRAQNAVCFFTLYFGPHCL